MAKRNEKKHLEKIGEQAYWRAFDRAQMACRQNQKLVGLSKIRDAIAHEAALQATGLDPKPFSLPKACGPATHSMQAIVDEMLPVAIEAAKVDAAAHAEQS